MAIGRINATLSGVQPGGLAKIVPTSIAVGSGSGSVDSNGTVTFSGASSVSINGAFSSLYEHYRLTIAMTNASGTGAQLSLRLRTGSDATTNYGTNAWYIALTQAGSGLEGHLVTSMSVGYVAGSSGWSYFSGDLFYPNAARQTGMNGIDSRSDGYGTFRSSIQTDSTQFTGFTVFPNNLTPTISGTIRVYGYN